MTRTEKEVAMKPFWELMASKALEDGNEFWPSWQDHLDWNADNPIAREQKEWLEEVLEVITNQKIIVSAHRGDDEPWDDFVAGWIQMWLELPEPIGNKCSIYINDETGIVALVHDTKIGHLKELYKGGFLA